MPDITFYVIGLLAASSLMMAWFHSSAPLHVFEFLRLCGFRKGDREFWEPIRHWETTWMGWADHIAINLPPFWSTLLTCKYCLSFHAALWISVVIWAIYPVCWQFIPISTLTWPILIVILTNKSK